ncbi:hypothetical protein TNCV_3988811 [Trichonephila clavipes]|nr:hypothetical protein TNCV_3988811 [Trichonephila clavipes]
MLAGWRGWFVAGILHPRLRVRPGPSQWIFMMQKIDDYAACKRAWVFSTKLNPSAGDAFGDQCPSSPIDGSSISGNWSIELKNNIDRAD